MNDRERILDSARRNGWAREPREGGMNLRKGSRVITVTFRQGQVSVVMIGDTLLPPGRRFARVMEELRRK